MFEFSRQATPLLPEAYLYYYLAQIVMMPSPSGLAMTGSQTQDLGGLEFLSGLVMITKVIRNLLHIERCIAL